MASYSELMEQAKALMAKAEQVRKDEHASVVAKIKILMKENGITLEDLGGVGKRTGAGIPRVTKSVAKYRGPNGELWSGGPGRKPEWVRHILAQGQSIEAFRI